MGPLLDCSCVAHLEFVGCARGASTIGGQEVGKFAIIARVIVDVSWAKLVIGLGVSIGTNWVEVVDCVVEQAKLKELRSIEGGGPEIASAT